MPCRPAGMRPDPAVSVPIAMSASPRGDGHGRARTRTPADVVGTAAVAYGAVWRPRADEPGGELVEIGLSEDDGARRAQCRHRGRVAVGVVGELGAGGGGGQPCDVDVVLDRQPHPGQCPAAARAFCQVGRDVGLVAAVDPHRHGAKPSGRQVTPRLGGAPSGQVLDEPVAGRLLRNGAVPAGIGVEVPTRDDDELLRLRRRLERLQ